MLPLVLLRQSSPLSVLMCFPLPHQSWIGFAQSVSQLVQQEVEAVAAAAEAAPHCCHCLDPFPYLFLFGVEPTDSVEHVANLPSMHSKVYLEC